MNDQPETERTAALLRGALSAAADVMVVHDAPKLLPVEQVKQESGGRMEIQLFPNSQLGGDSDLLSQVRSGAIDFFSTGGLIFANLVPIAAINGTGFAFKNADTVWPAMDGELGALIRRGFDDAGLHAFEKIWNNGFRQITSMTRLPLPAHAMLEIDGCAAQCLRDRQAFRRARAF